MGYPPKAVLAIAFWLAFSYLTAQVSQENKDKILELVGKSDLYIYDDPNRSLTYSNEAYELALGSGNDSLIAITLNNLGRARWSLGNIEDLSLIHISEPTRLRRISYAVFCLKKKKKKNIKEAIHIINNAI